MKQFSSLLYKEEDLMLCLKKAEGLASSMGQLSDILVFLFASELAQETMTSFESETRRIFPQAKVVGIAAECGFANGRIWSMDISAVGVASAAVTFVFLESSQVVPLAFDCQEDVLADGRALVETISRTPDMKLVGLLFAHQLSEPNEFLRLFSEAPNDVVFFGGLLSEYNEEGRVMIDLAGRRMKDGLLALLFTGKELHAKVLPSLGWRAFGPTVTVTRMADPRRLVELDGKPAGEFFSHYLGIRQDLELSKGIENFPIYIKRNDVQLARRLIHIHDDGSVDVSADLSEGERLRIASGDPVAIIREAHRIHEEVCAFSPEGVFIVNCLGHHLILQENAEQEYAAISKAVPTCGFYSFAEFLRKDGAVMKTNLTMLTVALREGPLKEPPILGPVLPKFVDQTSIIAHLMHFVDAVTQEWEEARSKLLVLAERDSLTGLLNRRAMEQSMRDILENTLTCGTSLAVLMLDMDNFKGINDTFGHAMGDRALVALADVLRASTRSADITSRWGGDEFFVILVRSDRDVVERVAERIRAGAAALKILPDGRRINLSIGATLSRPDDTLDLIFKRADEALYASKSVPGKNSVTYR